MYKPTKPFTTPLLYFPVENTERKHGVLVKTYAVEGILFFGSFATYGGAERVINGAYSVEDTASIETWFRPEFAADGRVALADHPEMVYEVVGEPENIEMRNQFCKMKVHRVRGGA